MIMKKIFTLIAMLAATLGMQAQDTWTIAGVSALCGSSWSATDTSNDMVLESGSTYKLVKEGCVLEEGTNYEYKVLKNHEWGNEGENNFGAAGGGNAVLTVAETGTYTVTFTFVADDSHALSAVAVKTGGAVIGEKTWTVAGVAALLGVAWSPEATENDMEKQSDGSFKLVKTGVALEADIEYEYKVAANHAWDESYGLNGGGSNAFVMVDAAGTYDVTFTFNPNTSPKTVEATATVSTGIRTIDVEIDQNAPRYDLSGRRVDNNFRGVVIQNGKKVLVK